MEISEAVALIREGVPNQTGVWVDLGAGSGVFTRALVKTLGAGSRVYAIERDAHSIAEVERWTASDAPPVTPVNADFTEQFPLPGHHGPLDGILLANSLHFIRNQTAVLRRWATQLKAGGRVVLVEYDRRASSRWVPYPICAASLPSLAASVGLSEPTMLATRPSEYGGILYSAFMEWPGGR